MKRPYSVARSIAICMVLLVPQSSAHSQAKSTAVETNESNLVAGIDDLREMESRVTKAVDKALPAIVAIGNRFGRNPESVLWEGQRFATGVIIREDGLILSQYHVSHTGVVDFDNTGLTAYGKPGDKVDIILHDGRRVEAELLGGERLADVSLLRLTAPGPYPYVTLANDDSVALGDCVVKLGHPVRFQPARGAAARLGRVTYANSVNLVTDCLTAGGDSGGPIINLDAEIVGLIQNDYMPFEVARVASNRGFPMSYMTSAKVRRKLGSMLANAIPHETTFEDHEERKRMYAETTATLDITDGRNGSKVRASWNPIANANKGCIVDVLGVNRKRVAYGTVVATDGWIVTKASLIPEYPTCRLPDRQVIGARVIGVDQRLDLALLKVNATGLHSVQWTTNATYQTGSFVMTVNSDSTPVAAGIVSSGVHTDPICIENDQIVSGSYPKIFEHDMSLKTSQYGGPVFNLDGHAIGITIADAGLHGCLSIPAKEVVHCLERLRN